MPVNIDYVSISSPSQGTNNFYRQYPVNQFFQHLPIVVKSFCNNIFFDIDNFGFNHKHTIRQTCQSGMKCVRANYGKTQRRNVTEVYQALITVNAFNEESYY